MGLIDSIIEDSFKAVLWDADRFPTETIVYKPLNGTPNTIQAIVTRGGMRTNYGGGKSVGYEVEVWIANDAIKGVTAIDGGKDRINMKVRLDKEAEDCKIEKVFADSDSVAWHLLIKG